MTGTTRTDTWLSKTAFWRAEMTRTVSNRQRKLATKLARTRPRTRVGEAVTSPTGTRPRVLTARRSGLTPRRRPLPESEGRADPGTARPRLRARLLRRTATALPVRQPTLQPQSPTLGARSSCVPGSRRTRVRRWADLDEKAEWSWVISVGSKATRPLWRVAIVPAWPEESWSDCLGSNPFAEARQHLGCNRRTVRHELGERPARHHESADRRCRDHGGGARHV